MRHKPFNHHEDQNPNARRKREGNGQPWGLIAAATLAGAAAAMLAPRANKLMSNRKSNDKDDVLATITIDRPAAELYRRWREYDQFELFMRDVISVSPSVDGREADWTIRGPGGTELEFRSRITEDEPDRLIAWESTDNPGRHEGRVTFRETERGTVVRLSMNLHPPMGPLGEAAAWISGKASGTDPQTQARRALSELKRIMEQDEATQGMGGGGAAWSGVGGQSHETSPQF